MMHNVSHQPLLFTTFIVLFSSSLTAQVRIKERLEIKPKPPAQAVVSAEPVMFTEDPNPGGLPHVLVVHACFITASATIEMHGAPSSDLYVKTSAGGAIAWYNGHGYSPPLHGDNPVTFRAQCASVPIKLESTWEGSDIRSMTKTITFSSAMFVINGMLSGTPYTVTAQLSAVSDNSSDLRTMDLTSERTQLTQCQTDAGVRFEATDNTGGFYYGMTCTGRVYHKISVQSSYDVSLEHQGNWLKEVEYDWGLRGSRVRWNYHGETAPGTATFTWQIEGQSKTKTFDLVVAPEEMKITFGKDEIEYGESTTVRADAKNRDGTLSPIPAGWTVWFQMMEGSDKGFLYSLDGKQTGDWIVGTSPEVKFQANSQANSPGQILVPIATWITNDNGGVMVSTRSSDKSDSLRKPNLLLKNPFAAKMKSLASSDGNPLQMLSTRATVVEPCQGSSAIDTLVVKKKTQVDHFLVLLSRDTIAYHDACVFFVIALGADNKEVPLDSGKVVMFVVDSSRYGSYLINNSVRMDTSIIQVPYGLARSGEIQYASDGIDPIYIGPRTLNFRVYLRDEATKKGTACLTIKSRAIITLKFSKNELKPLGDSDNKNEDPKCVSPPTKDSCRKVIDFSKVDNCTLTLSVTDHLGKGIADYPFWIQTGVRDSSGGHDHATGRPTGWLITPDKDTVKLFRGKTDTTGKSIFRYLCSGVGGVDSVYAEGMTKKDTATATLSLTMGKFDSLEIGTHYDLIGQYGTHDVQSPHRMNHYGSQALIGMIKALSDTAFNDKKIKLRINDMSLELGGPFDCSPHSLWNTPHQNHREGVSVDIDDQATTSIGANTLVTKKHLNDWAQRVQKGGLSIGDERTHFHLTIK